MTETEGRDDIDMGAPVHTPSMPLLHQFGDSRKVPPKAQSVRAELMSKNQYNCKLDYNLKFIGRKTTMATRKSTRRRAAKRAGSDITAEVAATRTRSMRRRPRSIRRTRRARNTGRGIECRHSAQL